MMYDPSQVGRKGSIFGYPYLEENADLILLPIHLDVTASYGIGTASAPDLILEASSQLDLSIPDIVDPWQFQVAMTQGLVNKQDNERYRKIAGQIIEKLENGDSIDDCQSDVDRVNLFCEEIHVKVQHWCDAQLARNKVVAVVGGDHSSPIGLIRALAKRHTFGILQIDAHMDLRNTYEGFTYSHASIMYQAALLDQVKVITQVGIRDYAKVEEDFVATSDTQVHTFFTEKMFADQMEGTTWKEQVDEIIQTLPDLIYISFDIDGLEPSLCPNTGTPVPGGLNFQEAIFLLEQVVRSKKRIIGFDLCEVGNGIWDGNVGARLLYRLATYLGVSQEFLRFKP